MKGQLDLCQTSRKLMKSGSPCVRAPYKEARDEKADPVISCKTILERGKNQPEILTELPN
jgi:hypothetical protein